MKEGDHEKARAYLQESLTYYERIGDHRFINVVLGYLGLNAIDSGDLAAARSHLEAGLAIARILDFTIGLATPLMYFAVLAAARGHPGRALRLCGASEALAASAGAVATRLTRPVVERWLDKSRLDLGPKRSAVLGGRPCNVSGTRHRICTEWLTRKTLHPPTMPISVRIGLRATRMQSGSSIGTPGPITVSNHTLMVLVSGFG